MQVILKDDVDHLGYKGDVVEVRKGYWRNYLGPRDLAETATAARVAELQEEMDRRRSAEARNETEALELQSLLNRTILTIPAFAGEQGKLFGSVGSPDIAKALESARKIRLDRRKIRLDEPIKSLGTFMVPVEVYAGVTAEIKTIVVEKEGTPQPASQTKAAAPGEEVTGAEAAETAAGDAGAGAADTPGADVEQAAAADDGTASAAGADESATDESDS